MDFNIKHTQRWLQRIDEMDVQKGKTYRLSGKEATIKEGKALTGVDNKTQNAVHLIFRHIDNLHQDMKEHPEKAKINFNKLKSVFQKFSNMGIKEKFLSQIEEKVSLFAIDAMEISDDYRVTQVENKIAQNRERINLNFQTLNSMFNKLGNDPNRAVSFLSKCAITKSDISKLFVEESFKQAMYQQIDQLGQQSIELIKNRINELKGDPLEAKLLISNCIQSKGDLVASNVSPNDRYQNELSQIVENVGISFEQQQKEIVDQVWSQNVNQNRDVDLEKFDQLILSAAQIKETAIPDTQEKIFISELTDAVLLSKPNTCNAFQGSKSKNRYNNILCPDYSRVHAGPKGEYIHANHIHLDSGLHCIAAQGPQKNTLDDHFRMLLHNKVPLQVRLTKDIEDGRNKCHNYWDKPDKYDLGDGLVVEVTSTNDLSSEEGQVIGRESKLIFRKDGEVLHRCEMFHFEAWPDHGVPKEEHGFNRFMNLLKQADQRMAMHPKEPPCIHCSAGVGRTGTMIAVMSIIREIKAQKANGIPLNQIKLNVSKTVLKMRQQRPKAVQRPEQYQLIFKAVQAYLQNPW